MLSASLGSREIRPHDMLEKSLFGGEQVIVEGLQAVPLGIAVRASPLPRPLRQG
jgi:hypothetical protein